MSNNKVKIISNDLINNKENKDIIYIEEKKKIKDDNLNSDSDSDENIDEKDYLPFQYNFSNNKKQSNENNVNINDNYTNNKDDIPNYNINNNIINNINDNTKNNFNYNKYNDKSDNLNNNQEINYNSNNRNILNNSTKKIMFDLSCNICNKIKNLSIIYCCIDCKVLFCDECEAKKGKTHKHCFYKIRTEKQFLELKDRLNRMGIKIANMNNNINRNIINDEINLRSSMKEMISSGCKLFKNIGKSFKKLLNPIEDRKNNLNPNELNIPYMYNDDNNQNNDEEYIPNEEKLRLLVREARTRYNLTNVNEIALESALVKSKDNIENAVNMLFEDKYI